MRKTPIFLAVILVCFCFFGCAKESDNDLLLDYSINLEFFSDNTLNARQTVSVKNTKSYGISCLYFSFYPLAFTENATQKPYTESRENTLFPNGKSYAKTNLNKVEVNGESADYEVENITLKIGLPRQLKSGETATVYIDYSLALPNAIHRFGYGENTVNLTGFYPVLCTLEKGKYYKPLYYPVGDPFNAYSSNFSVSLTVPSTLVVASSLKTESVVWEGDKTTYNMRREKARDIALVLSSDFSVAKKSSGGVEVYYYYFNDKNFENSLEVASSSLNYYASLYGDYPYGEYVVCQADFLYGGMEYSGLSIISGSLVETDYVIAHETAHQWWHGIVGFNECEIAFLDEGLTEFSTAKYMDFSRRGEYLGYIENAKNQYLAIRKTLIENGITTPPILERSLKDFKSETEYFIMAYNRSLIAFNHVKNEVGETKFLKALKAFCKKYAFKNATYDNFLKVLNSFSNRGAKLLKEYSSGVKVIK